LNEATEPAIAIGKLPVARGDERLIRQVWVNLLDNAVKYSSKVERPHINITGREEAERLVYEISDNGRGATFSFSLPKPALRAVG
jgi:K+-sensing histidine kinase KdpD